jgi:hypothetical protein
MVGSLRKNNWRYVGDHVERNWLSIRRSPCNKRNIYWSVLMCCKKFLSYILNKKLYSTYSSFLIISVCNRGTTLCSPCTSQVTSVCLKIWVFFTLTLLVSWLYSGYSLEWLFVLKKYTNYELLFYPLYYHISCYWQQLQLLVNVFKSCSFSGFPRPR